MPEDSLVEEEELSIKELLRQGAEREKQRKVARKGLPHSIMLPAATTAMPDDSSEELSNEELGTEQKKKRTGAVRKGVPLAMLAASTAATAAPNATPKSTMVAKKSRFFGILD
jgi:hypothetical protein